MSKEKQSFLIKQIAQNLGFDFCGISEATFLEEEAPKLDQWLNQGFHGKMNYMSNHFDKRLDPTKLVPGAKSVISLIYNYYPDNQHRRSGHPKIAKYAYGQDYHYVIKDKLRIFIEEIRKKIGEVEGRVFVDSAPVHERAWAKKSGMGWVGKNSLLLNKKMGSFFFLAELILDLALISDQPIKDYCGTCTACQDACPTDAIPKPYVVDANKCISYLTIELKEEIPKTFQQKMENWVFGCDVCQDVCPWNRFAKPTQEPLFRSQGWENFTLREWQEMTKQVFKKTFKKSAIKRAKYEGLKRNVEFLQLKEKKE